MVWRVPGKWLAVSDPPWLRFGRLGSAVFLVIGCVLIGTWQLSYSNAPKQIDPSYSHTPGMRGIYREPLQRFFYFLYFTGKFPISMDGPRRVFGNDESTARRFLSNENLYLRNEVRAVIRSGDLGKIFLLYPDLMGAKAKAMAKVKYDVDLSDLHVPCERDSC